MELLSNCNKRSLPNRVSVPASSGYPVNPSVVTDTAMNIIVYNPVEKKSE